MGIIEEYNYDSFVPEKFERWLRFHESPPVGTPLPNFPLTDLDGNNVELRELWRAKAYTIMEFGSFT